MLVENKTALAHHHFDTGHQFDFENVRVLDYEQNYKKRIVSEMIHINLCDSVNLKTDTQNLSNIYSNILKKYHDKKALGVQVT